MRFLSIVTAVILLAACATAPLCPALKTRSINAGDEVQDKRPGWKDCHVSVGINWLEIEEAKTPELRKAVNTWLTLQLLPDWKQEHAGASPLTQEAVANTCTRGFIEFWKAEVDETEAPSRFLGWESTATAEKVFDDGKWVTLQTSFYGYTGGAHGDGWGRIASFNADTGERLDLKNAFTEQGAKAFWALAFSRAQEQVGPFEQTAEKTMESESREFGLVKEGLCLEYNRGVCYSDGDSSLVFSWKELKPFAKPGGPLDR